MMNIGELPELNQLKGDWENIRYIVPYGFGTEAMELLPKIIRDFNVPFIIDTDSRKWGRNFLGVPVVSPENLSKLGQKDKVLITPARRAKKVHAEIKKVLEGYGMIESWDFIHISTFISEWYYRYRGECIIVQIDNPITTACTLNCKNCNMFIPYYSKQVMVTFDEFKNSFDLLMGRVDYVFKVAFIGGESVLNPDLIKMIEYIKDKYNDKIGHINILTNGVVIFNENLIKQLKKNDVLVEISDYTDALGIKSRVEELRRLLIYHGIKVSVMRNRVWCKVGYPENSHAIDPKIVREHMLQCNGWRGLNDGKFYFCNVAWSIDKAGQFKLNEDDYINLADLPANTKESKEKILAYSLGYMLKGYMSFCQYCGGCGPDNQNYVLAGEQ